MSWSGNPLIKDSTVLYPKSPLVVLTICFYLFSFHDQGKQIEQCAFYSLLSTGRLLCPAPSIFCFRLTNSTLSTSSSTSWFKTSFHACFSLFNSFLLIYIFLKAWHAVQHSPPGETLLFLKKQLLVTSWMKDAAYILEWDLFSSFCSLINLNYI